MAAQASVKRSPAGQRPGNGAYEGIVDVLLAQNLLNQDQAKIIRDTEIQTGRSQEEILKNKNIISGKDLAKAKAKLYNVPFVDVLAIPSSPEALAILTKEVAEKYLAYPVSIDKDGKELTLAMANPLDLAALEFIEQKTGLRIIPNATDPGSLKEAINTQYKKSLAKEVTEALEEVKPQKPQISRVDLTSGSFIKEEKVAEVVKHILEFAIRARASDVHLEPGEMSTRVRYRIDGILQEKLTIPKSLHEAIISRIKILSGMKIDEKRIPQDGRFNITSGEDEVDLRVSSLPTAWGEKIVMRLLKKTGGIPDLIELGLRGRALKNLEDAILRPHGIILICGPTGSGKTTTLYSIIQRLNTTKVNIMTLEDPIEYKIPGVNQVQINPAAGLTFASGLRSFLRQDPNIILVGEIRDQETADLAIQASLTGHLVFSTLHTNDASGALPRLLDMGAEPYLISSSVTAIAAQRVVRKVHQECKTTYEPEASIKQELKNVLGSLWPQDDKVVLSKGKGDKNCSNTGYFGRMGIFEVLPITEKVGRLILERQPSSLIEKQAVSEGMITLKQDGYLKVLEGITSVDEIIRVAQD